MERFSGRRLWAMILPLFVEQLLVMVVGLTDMLMVSHAGEAAVSGVALVNQFNIIFLYLFLALASGGAVVISQYIGRRENEQAGRTASQLLALSIVVSLGLTGFVLAAGQMLLSLLFGRVEPDVMAACSRYLQITACGYPAMAVYYAWEQETWRRLLIIFANWENIRWLFLQAGISLSLRLRPLYWIFMH